MLMAALTATMLSVGGNMKRGPKCLQAASFLHSLIATTVSGQPGEGSTVQERAVG